MGVKNFFAKVDSRLFANQINGSYIAKEQSIIQYMEKYRALIHGFKVFSIEQVPISENKQADALIKIASINFSYLTKQVLIEVLKEKSIKEKEIFTIVEEEGHTWMTLLFHYLMEGTQPAETKKAKAVKIKSRQYVVIGGVLYRRSYLEPWLRRKHVRQRKAIREQPFKERCEKLNIKKTLAFVKHPQTNGLVERENRSLGEGIKAHLDKGSKNKLEDIPHVLWEHRTMVKSINVDTPFSLTYETKAKILVENGMPSLRCMEVDQVRNNESLLLNLDMLQEKR
ncbi:reverse transcriptase domain-containing protein [Tanacetum coccineum]